MPLINLQFQTIETDRELIAHAAGGSQAGSYPNAVESLDLAYQRGYRSFEFDLQWTRDDELVGLHDWRGTLAHWYDLNTLPARWRWARRLWPGCALPAPIFFSLPMRLGWTPLTPERLRDWLSCHPDCWLVTDIKRDNPRALTRLAQVFGESRSRVLAQVFSLGELELAQKLGFGRTGWANYGPKWSLSRLLQTLPGRGLDVLVLDESRLRLPQDTGLLDQLDSAGLELWVFTVNNPERLHALPASIRGVITDSLLPV
ncbi:MAG: glycerophosphodiester phosphodiesterase family protein [Wenzhouxiangella sp.]